MNTDGEKPAPRANDVQYGGDHYRKVSGEQHWDRLVRLFGLPHARCYFVGNATAYAERYLEKGGVTDLHKAAHYLRKLAELEEDPTLGGSLAWLRERREDTETRKLGASVRPAGDQLRRAILEVEERIDRENAEACEPDAPRPTEGVRVNHDLVNNAVAAAEEQLRRAVRE